MNDITPSDVINHVAALGVPGAVSDGAWVDVLRYVNQWKLTCIDSDHDRKLARILLAAHIIYATGTATSTTGSGLAAAGPVVAEAAGGLRRTYAQMNMAASTNNLKTTRFGQQFEDILDASGAGGPFLV